MSTSFVGSAHHDLDERLGSMLISQRDRTATVLEWQGVGFAYRGSQLLPGVNAKSSVSRRKICFPESRSGTLNSR